jgi:hypothetical protein
MTLSFSLARGYPAAAAAARKRVGSTTSIAGLLFPPPYSVSAPPFRPLRELDQHFSPAFGIAYPPLEVKPLDARRPTHALLHCDNAEAFLSSENSRGRVLPIARVLA